MQAVGKGFAAELEAGRRTCAPGSLCGMPATTLGQSISKQLAAATARSTAEQCKGACWLLVGLILMSCRALGELLRTPCNRLMKVCRLCWALACSPGYPELSSDC